MQTITACRWITGRFRARISVPRSIRYCDTARQIRRSVRQLAWTLVGGRPAPSLRGGSLERVDEAAYARAIYGAVALPGNGVSHRAIRLSSVGMLGRRRGR